MHENVKRKFRIFIFEICIFEITFILKNILIIKY